MELSRLRERLAELATEGARSSYERTVKPKRPIYGVKTPHLNALAKELVPSGLEGVQTLWQGDSYEERLIAAKLIGRLTRKHPEAAWAQIQRMAEELDDWPTCDTLATESIRGLLPEMAETVFEAAIRYWKNNGEWQRRFGLVLLTNYVGDRSRRLALHQAIRDTSTDHRHYVKHAAEWLRRDILKDDARGDRA